MKNLIKELLYAKKMHRLAMQQDKDILKQKDFVIKVLKSKKRSGQDIKKARQYIEFWKETHENWIELIRLNPKWAKTGGTIAWQKRWVKFYDSVLKNLS